MVVRWKGTDFEFLDEESFEALSTINYTLPCRNYSPVNWDLDKKIPYVHYSEAWATTERVVFGLQDDRLTYNYDDRLCQWDYKKWQSSRQIEGIEKRNPRYWQEVLRKYWDDPELELGCIITAVNQSNGFQYLVFGCKHSKKQEATSSQ
jgi:hypothetical protein